MIQAGTRRWTSGGLPDTVEHAPGTVTARWSSFAITPPRTLDTSVDARPGRRELQVRVEGRTLVIRESFAFDEVPDALSITIPETATRPLHVAVQASTAHRTLAIEVGGINEWRSYWSELERVHQIELDPAPRVEVTLRVTPKLRVVSTAFDHPYGACLYESLSDRIHQLLPRPTLGDPDNPLRDVDLLHLHWPEGLGLRLADHQRFIDRLREAAVPIVWTAHNLRPHGGDPDLWRAIYQAWASAAAAVIHHSHWGERRVRERYTFAPGCRHVVIPHGHFGRLYPAVPRAEAERALGLPPAPLRIGLIGAPRRDKKVLAFLAGLAASARPDLQVVCWSLRDGEEAPRDPRIAIAEPHRQVDDRTYALRLAACDALALPFDPTGDMLTTGTAADAVGAGLPVLGSDWGYLRDTLGAALIPCGHTADSVRAALDGLDIAALAEARQAAIALQPALDWRPLAERTADLFEEVYVSGPRV
jgi:glycosyltransferase involved in cell wall biosynthesis